MKVNNALIISDDSKDRLGELNFVSHKFCNNIDAIVFSNKSEIEIDANKVFGFNTLPVNAIDRIAQIAKNYDVVLTNGIVGAYVGGILAYKLNMSCVFGVNEIKYDDFIFIHSAYGDKALFEYKIERLPALIVLKEKYFEALASTNKVNVEYIEADVSQQDAVTVIKEEKIEKTVDLGKAKIVVGGGRGIGSKEGFAILEKIAKKLGGVAGASRAAVDNNWISYQYQIGQSGAMLSADAYFAFGISGATQHLAGIKNVKCVIAINTDEQAPIFKRARYNIVADWKEFANALINQLEAVNG